MDTRNYSMLDRFVIQAGRALSTSLGPAPQASRNNPAKSAPATNLSEADQQLSARLMRVNHAGEVAAQALYQGQALTARLPGVREAMDQAAQEETDHLAWCADRLKTLGSAPSYLNPLWYTGAFTIGAIAGLAGDKWSLGFVAETERQVVQHLEGHLSRLPPEDTQSKAILAQMKTDEAHHGDNATRAGAARLPVAMQKLMTMASRIMTGTAYWI